MVFAVFSQANGCECLGVIVPNKCPIEPEAGQRKQVDLLRGFMKLEGELRERGR